MPFFSKVFKSKDGATSISKRNQVDNAAHTVPLSKPRFTSTWDSTEVVVEEVEELLHACTAEMKTRAELLDTPFLLLPFRPDTDVNSARTFIHNFFKANREGSPEYVGEGLRRELRLTGHDSLCAIVKWVWSRIPEGVVSWNVYASFRAGEQESGMVVNSFDSFIPISVQSESRRNIIYDFFDLLSAIAAHGKVNGMGGRKLSRMAGWWAFEQSDTGKGFVGGYKSWTDAADAASHLFFAYLRSRAPDAVKGIAGISNLPRALQALVAQTEYPPQRPAAMQSSTAKVLMIVDSVSPTPFALLRRARLFDYRADDKALNKFAEYSDPVDALTEECIRVLEAIAATNQSSAARSRRGNISSARLPSNFSLSAGDDSWSRFQDEGFSSAPVDSAAQSPSAPSPLSKRDSPPFMHPNMAARTQSRLAVGGRPTTPSWADFLNSGFIEEGKGRRDPTIFLPPDQQLPPVVDRSSMASSLDDDDLRPGELASINRFELDESFWWVWMTSLGGEETSIRKSAFGRCALVETSISGGRWLLLEEQVKGAAQGQAEGAYIAEKRSRSIFSRRNRSTKKKTGKKSDELDPARLAAESAPIGSARANMSPDQKAKISAAAAAIARQQTSDSANLSPSRRGRFDDAASTKTNSMMTVGFTQTASPAMKWANAYDRDAIRKQYLGDDFAGRGLGGSIAESGTSTPYGEKENRDPLKDIEAKTVADKPVDTDKPLPSPAPVETVLPHPPVEPPVINIHPSEELEDATSEPVMPLQDPTETVSQPMQDANPTDPALQKIHPAFRNAATTEASDTSHIPAPVAPSEVPVRSSSKKLQKKPQGSTGLMKMFGKKKDDPKCMSSEVAGFKAPDSATESPQQPSRIPQRRAVKDMVQNFETVQQAPPAKVTRVNPEPPSRPAPTALTPLTEDFNRFDQGPLDAPAFVPRESFETDSIQSPAGSTFPERGIEGNTSRKPQVQGPSAFAQSQQALVTTNSNSGSEVHADTDSVSTASVTQGDRWAQIRRNAAERAAKAGKEPGARGQATGTAAERTGSDTSNEESESSAIEVRTTTPCRILTGTTGIDERVARIKARVAQLTGNMDMPAGKA